MPSCSPNHAAARITIRFAMLSSRASNLAAAQNGAALGSRTGRPWHIGMIGQEQASTGDIAPACTAPFGLRIGPFAHGDLDNIAER
jgi:hypothetical protein